MIKIPVCFFYKLKKTLYSFYKRVVNRISKRFNSLLQPVKKTDTRSF
jgi:hypothetical protein